MRNLMAQKVARTAEVRDDLQDDIKAKRASKSLWPKWMQKAKEVNKWSSKVD
jgi:hypothetical protein